MLPDIDLGDTERLAIRAQALDLAVRWYGTPDVTPGKLWPTVIRMERYLLTGDPDEPAPAPVPEPPAGPTKGERIIAAAHAWYNEIPDGSNVGLWAADRDVELCNAVRAALGLPEFDREGDKPWTK